MKKRLLISLLSAGLVGAMLPGVAAADCGMEGEHPDVRAVVENFGSPMVAGPRFSEAGWEWYREPKEGTPNAPGQNMLVWIGKCTP